MYILSLENPPCWSHMFHFFQFHTSWCNFRFYILLTFKIQASVVQHYLWLQEFICSQNVDGTFVDN